MEDIMGIFMIIIIVIGCCVVLPLLIVWMNNKRKNHEIDKKTEILKTLLEKNPDMDPTEIMNKLNMSQKSNKTMKQKLLDSLFSGLMLTLMGLVILVLHLDGMISFGSKAIGLYSGGVMMAIGVAFLIYYFVSKSALRNELEAEERELKEKQISE